MKKGFQKDRPLPLKTEPADAVYQRNDSRFWQARYRLNGKLIRRSTRLTNQAAALEWIACAKRTPEAPAPTPQPEVSQLSLL